MKKLVKKVVKFVGIGLLGIIFLSIIFGGNGDSIQELKQANKKIVELEQQVENYKKADEGDNSDLLNRINELEKENKQLKNKVNGLNSQLANSNKSNNNQNNKPDFEYKNISFKDNGNYIKVIGEITNNSGKDYKVANFMISVYNNEGNLVSTGYANISNLSNGQTKSINTLIEGQRSKVSKYKIQFENGF